MHYDLPYGREFLPVDIPDDNLLFVAETNKVMAGRQPLALVEAALDSPYGCGRLEELAVGSKRVLILLDDITRPTPRSLLLGPVLERLSMAGVREEDISLAIALGTHRPMTEEEIWDALGETYADRFPIINIDYRQKDRFVSLGKSPAGIEIEVYREVAAADFVIGIGNIVPHVSAGWGGGAKIVQPGVCGESTTRGTHLMSCLEQDVMEVCGNAENKCRHEMEEIAGRVGLRFIVNTVMDEHRNLMGVFCGHYRDAHRAGVEFAKQVLCPAIPRPADILIASANPCEADFWQADKPYLFAQYGIRDEGVLIFAVEGREGLCGTAPAHDSTVRKYCLSSFEEIKADMDRGAIDDLIAVDAPIFHAQIRKRGIDVLLVSRFSGEDADCLGFEKTETLQDALRIAFERLGKDAMVGVIPYAGETLVKVENSRRI